MTTEVKKPEAKPAEIAGEKTPDKTVAEVIGAAPAAGDKKPDEGAGEMVPLSSLLDFKKETKELKKTIKELEAKIAEGTMSKDDVDEEIEALAKEHDVDPKFAKSMAKILGGRAEKKAGETLKPLLETNDKLTKKERDEEIHRRFTKAFDAEIEKAPEFKEIANPDVIKALTLLPENAKKTFRQIIEETYGKAITGKRTIDSTAPGGGKDPDPLDMDRARRDTNYFKEVMANPELKKEYNAKMLQPNRRRG